MLRLQSAVERFDVRRIEAALPEAKHRGVDPALVSRAETILSQVRVDAPA